MGSSLKATPFAMFSHRHSTHWPFKNIDCNCFKASLCNVCWTGATGGNYRMMAHSIPFTSQDSPESVFFFFSVIITQSNRASSSWSHGCILGTEFSKAGSALLTICPSGQLHFLKDFCHRPPLKRHLEAPDRTPWMSNLYFFFSAKTFPQSREKPL